MGPPQEIARLVIDTNVLISALLFRGPSNQVVERLHSHQWKLIINHSILQEYLRVLAYPKFKLDKTTIEALVQQYVIQFAEIQADSMGEAVSRDPDDDKFLFCAFDAGAVAIVSGDEDLLELGSYQGIPIFTIQEALKRF